MRETFYTGLDYNPSRVTAGVLEGAPVVFGDGAKIELLKAVGITKPEAVIITLAAESRRLDATMRLRSCLPNDTPIYVFKGSNKVGIGKELIEAGATEVICQTTETILRLGSLLGACDSEEEVGRLRQLCDISQQTTITKASAATAGTATMAPSATTTIMRSANLRSEVSVNGLSEEATIDLADEIGISTKDLIQTWEDFDSAAQNREAVPISELKSMMMRLSNEGPSDGEDYELCLNFEDEDGRGELTFVEYAKAVWMDCAVDLSRL